MMATVRWGIFSYIAIIGLISVLPAAQAAGAKKGSVEVELFGAMKDGSLAVRVLLPSEKELVVWLENKTDKPLAVKMPTAFAAKPVLAQFQPPGGGFQPFGANPAGGGAGQGNQPQAVAAPANRGNNAARLPALFNIPAGKTTKLRLDSVCAEFGKPEPTDKDKYELVSLEEVSNQPGVKAALELFGNKQTSQRVAQLAVWHLANGKSWDELKAMKIRNVFTRRSYPTYSAEEIDSAQRLAKHVLEQQEPAMPKGASDSRSLSQR